MQYKDRKNKMYLIYAALIGIAVVLGSIDYSYAVENDEIGMLLYTHGDMVNAPDSPHVEKMMAMKQELETKYGTPVEIVYHMPYNWDEGLVKLDTKEVKYAIFLYTDPFGPKSTVIHNLTRGVFGGIPEYNYCPGIPLPNNGCMYMGQKTFPASYNGTIPLIFAEPARPDHPALREIYLKQAVSVSEDPSKEILVLVGHGARSNINDMYQELELSRAAKYVATKVGFIDSIAFTAREDWEHLRGEAIAEGIEQIKTLFYKLNAERIVLIPATGGRAFDMVKGNLTDAGIPFIEAPKALPIGQNEYVNWAIKIVGETIEFIKTVEPTNSTITPYWNRDYYIQGIELSKKSIMPNENIDITCYNEPSNPSGVVGYIEVVGDTGSWRTPIVSFNTNATHNYLMKQFPTDFNTNSTAGTYTIFCKVWDGQNFLNEVEEVFWVRFMVLPESIIGSIAIVATTFMIFIGYSYKTKR